MKKVLFVLLTIVMVSACSKETKIKNNLWKQGGDWEISSYTYQYGSVNPSNPNQVSNGYYTNCGNFKFSKDGTGTITLITDGDTEAAAFTYSNTEDKLTLVFDGSYAAEYKLDWSKDVITIKYNKDGTDPDGYNTYDNESYVLKKK